MDSVASAQAGVAFEAMLLVPVLRPLFGADDGLGDYGVDVLARAIAERDRSGFSGLVAAALQ